MPLLKKYDFNFYFDILKSSSDLFGWRVFVCEYFSNFQSHPLDWGPVHLLSPAIRWHCVRTSQFILLTPSAEGKQRDKVWEFISQPKTTLALAWDLLPAYSPLCQSYSSESETETDLPPFLPIPYSSTT